jgi:hypothetical protein
MTGRLARVALAGLVVSLALVGSEAQPACAQDMSALSGMEFYVTPYLWLSGINAAIKTPLERAPEVNTDVSAIDLLSHLNGVPFMGAFEVRQGPLGFLGDVLHVPVGTNITTWAPGSCSIARTISQPNSPISASGSALGASRPI